MDQKEEKDQLMFDGMRALGLMGIAIASGSSTKKHEKRVRNSIKGVTKLGDDWAARLLERKLEERLREAGK